MQDGYYWIKFRGIVQKARYSDIPATDVEKGEQTEGRLALNGRGYRSVFFGGGRCFVRTSGRVWSRYLLNANAARKKAPWGLILFTAEQKAKHHTYCTRSNEA
ncbi:Uncharacterised protein [Enterobacter cancerogenus]|uniref:Uncharacterized protein n=1 Tax=Enterobacter cancerogenus TaxID=69218 RepID=A0A484Z036_9ENTR|nr:Uncharacterised protein [Enterobacter cancerogenus]